MNTEIQRFCGECQPVKFCLHAPDKGYEGRMQIVQNVRELVREKIEFCTIRLQKLAERQAKEDGKTTD